ncbi:MAG: hypothetical protein MRY81_07060 [Donghicola eburneus]|nr:hypothetical protein [Donghicola eburneus]MCI5039425.1 hypothetical protein [Donghicola eburneus]
MAAHDSNTGTGNSSNSVLAFIVAVVVLGFALYSGMDFGQDDDISISIEGAGPAAEQAGEALEGAANAVDDAAEDVTGQ